METNETCIFAVPPGYTSFSYLDCIWACNFLSGPGHCFFVVPPGYKSSSFLDCTWAYNFLSGPGHCVFAIPPGYESCPLLDSSGHTIFSPKVMDVAFLPPPGYNSLTVKFYLISMTVLVEFLRPIWCSSWFAAGCRQRWLTASVPMCFTMICDF